MSAMSHELKTAGIASAAAVFFVADRALKWLFSNVWDKAEFAVFGDWFKLKLALNGGIAFSLPADYRLVVALTAAVFSLLAYSAWLAARKGDFAVFAALAFVCAGAYSNLLDRIFNGAVVDYFQLEYFSVFNLADAMIACGIAAAIFLLSWKRRSLAGNKLEPSS